MGDRIILECTADEIDILIDALNCLLNEMTYTDSLTGYEQRVQEFRDRF